MKTRTLLAFLALSSAFAFGGCLRLKPEPTKLTCNTDDDCASGEKCMRRQGPEYVKTCVDDTYCEVNADCDSEDTCRDNTCDPLECLSDEDCGAYLCQANECVTRCSGESEGCRAGFRCDISSCKRIGGQDLGGYCSNNDDCLPGDFCYHSMFSCSRACSTNSDCGMLDGTQAGCSGSMCLPACKTDDDCWFGFCTDGLCQLPEGY